MKIHEILKKCLAGNSHAERRKWYQRISSRPWTIAASQAEYIMKLVKM